MPRRIESLFLQGSAGRLEALLEESEEQPVEAALVCHPHPKGGGTMHNKVVYRMARALRQNGIVVLRFNYRGVNLSEGTYDDGIGELDDARVALAELQARYRSLPVLVGGFSFGSRIALRLAAEQPDLARALAVGFPTTIPGSDYLHSVTVPKYFVHSTHDEFGPAADFSALYDTLAPPKHLTWIEGEDHFFKGALDPFESAIAAIGRAHSDGSSAAADT